MDVAPQDILSVLSEPVMSKSLLENGIEHVGHTPSDQTLHTLWTTWSIIFNLTSFFVFIMFLSILLTKDCRKNPFHQYLLAVSLQRIGSFYAFFWYQSIHEFSSNRSHVDDDPRSCLHLDMRLAVCCPSYKWGYMDHFLLSVSMFLFGLGRFKSRVAKWGCQYPNSPLTNLIARLPSLQPPFYSEGPYGHCLLLRCGCRYGWPYHH